MIINLEYNQSQRLFHFSDDSIKKRGWHILKTMDIDDAIYFTDFIDKKYVNNKQSGRIPELDIVKLELELFFKLKNVKRKLVR